MRALILLPVLVLILAAMGHKPDVAHAETCLTTELGTICLADPPPTPACSPYCVPPAPAPGTPGSVTVCHIYGWCQYYYNGTAYGPLFSPNDPVWGPFEWCSGDVCAYWAPEAPYCEPSVIWQVGPC